MKNYQQLTKKQLIDFIIQIRPKADAYDGVCQALGIKNDILGYIKKNCGQKELNKQALILKRHRDSNWKAEISSGYDGFRCQNCATWVYELEDKRCECDDELVNDTILCLLGFEIPSVSEGDKGHMFIHKELKIFFHQRPTFRTLSKALGVNT